MITLVSLEEEDGVVKADLTMNRKDYAEFLDWMCKMNKVEGGP